MTDIFSKSKRSEIMGKIRSKDTGPELMLSKAFRRNGVRNFVRYGNILGKPDFVFRKAKVAVFVDGAFWHGYGYTKIKRKLSPFWRNKIKRNMERDALVNRKLKKDGWKVIRICDRDLRKDPNGYANEIKMAII